MGRDCGGAWVPPPVQTKASQKVPRAFLGPREASPGPREASPEGESDFNTQPAARAPFSQAFHPQGPLRMEFG